VKEANEILLKLPPFRLLALHIRQAADLMTLRAVVQRRACQISTLPSFSSLRTKAGAKFSNLINRRAAIVQHGLRLSKHCRRYAGTTLPLARQTGITGP